MIKKFKKCFQTIRILTWPTNLKRASPCKKNAATKQFNAAVRTELSRSPILFAISLHEAATLG